MIYCRNCEAKASRIKVINGIDQCGNCSSMTETGGSKIDGSITRNSARIRVQQKQFEGDMQPPYVYDKAKRRGVPNKNFIKNFPDQAQKTFTTDEFKSVGVTKLKGKV